MGRGDASPTASTPPVPSSVARARDEISLRCLQRHDAKIRKIICQASFVSVYALCPSTRKWDRAHIQGGLHVVERDVEKARSDRKKESKWRLFVLNQRDTGVLLEDIDETFEMEGEKNHLFYRVTCPTTGQQRIHAIWVYDDNQRLSVQRTLQQIIDACVTTRSPAVGAPSADIAPQTRAGVSDVSSGSNSAGVHLLALLRGAQPGGGNPGGAGAQKTGAGGPTHPTPSPTSGGRDGAACGERQAADASGPAPGQSIMSLLGIAPAAPCEGPSGPSPLLPLGSTASLMGPLRPGDTHLSGAEELEENKGKNTSLSILSLLKRPVAGAGGTETGVSFPGSVAQEKPHSRGGLSPRSPREREPFGVADAPAANPAGAVSLVDMLKRSAGDSRDAHRPAETVPVGGEGRAAQARGPVSSAGLLGPSGAGLLGVPAPGAPLLPSGRLVPVGDASSLASSSPLLAAPLQRPFVEASQPPLAALPAQGENPRRPPRAPAYPAAAAAVCGAREVSLSRPEDGEQLLVSRSMLAEALQRVLESDAFCTLLWQQLAVVEARSREPRGEQLGENAEAKRRYSREDVRG
ncbi:putative mRNA decapping enzyme [Neospora caninum Liverpool]|uniref:Putative mRNA decapping enzyme n=1 Tax=Neospora caninum (strain Liverpool) TaxID=572307 RepID=F0V826_NEOCL|nr:putative mRNA decapping enzyme [Neospora caninum Liverpool]CBZ49867.1 putative mRNA decapping enzyme [Neospora caninum Liverpool]CEL64456.1 TPA: mRNA decapping enzyme, putative [Neospora caninum Liverpool]|eukprot:XP_003879902.1 putative mRNA decapping enzyme [Neospora caninum Liverpool]